VRRRASDGASGIVVVAEHQSAGRGRRGRAWHSPGGAGIYVSVLRTMRLPFEAITRCTLGAAVAACEACRTAGARDVAIEWPNDLVHRGRKLGGILCELRSSGPATSDLVVGTGINVLEPVEPRPGDLGERATSLARACGASMLDREELLVAYLERLGQVLDQIGGPGWSDLRARWAALAPRSSGASVRIATEGGEPSLCGTTAGVDDDGALLVRLRDGRTLRVRSVDTVLFEGE
jgi:BirA family transcriptional regulator, biotin operon repressor / biotin---[acetyl-CoA-carboxylase] ligase